MISEKDIVFITTTLYSKWLMYQQNIIKKLFPDSQTIIIDGRQNWPYAWFYWITQLKNTNCKWFIHIDEDCFIQNKDELIKLIQKMEDENYTLSAVSDGYHPYRGANPVAVNSFFMIGRIEHILELDTDFTDIRFWHEKNGWRNSRGIVYNEERHRKDFIYPHEKLNNIENTIYEQEPYYMLLWMLKERERKFYYLYPYFDDEFKSTNPRITKDSEDIAIHMWYTRQWNTQMDVCGLPNFVRYERVEKFLLNIENNKNETNKL
jgi:hypothetical protein